jgi:hypothetical protein
MRKDDPLIAIDVDDPDAAPEWIDDLPDTRRHSSPHGDGYHLLFKINDTTGIGNGDLPRDSGELRAENQYIVAPGSRCDCDSDECSGRYTISDERPIATITDDDDLDRLRAVQSDSSNSSTTTKSNTASNDFEFPKPIEEAREAQRRFEEFVDEMNPKPRNDLLDRLSGGEGDNEYRRDNDSGSIDQSKVDLSVLSDLYGLFLHHQDPKDEDCEKAAQDAVYAFKYAVLRDTRDDSGNLRKPIRKGEQYIERTIDHAVDTFDREQWSKWYRSGGSRSGTGMISETGEDAILAATDLLAHGADKRLIELSKAYDLYLEEPDEQATQDCLPPIYDQKSTVERRYPKAAEIAEMAIALNPEADESQMTYCKNNVRNVIRRNSDFAAAYCPRRPGHRKVYYPNNDQFPHPPDAETVTIHGVDIDPATVDAANFDIGPWNQPIAV